MLVHSRGAHTRSSCKSGHPVKAIEFVHPTGSMNWTVIMKPLSVSRDDLAAIDAQTLTATDWTPAGGDYAEIAVITPTEDAVVVDGSFVYMSGLPQAYLAVFR
jgi:hypothetical protein